MKAFALKRDAQRWLTEQTAHIVRGTYVDPGAGRTTFAEFYADRSSGQVWAPGMVLAMNLAAGSVPFADVPLRSLRRSHVPELGQGNGQPGSCPRHRAHSGGQCARRPPRRRRRQADGE